MLTQEQLKAFQEALKDTLKFTTQFCEEHDLHYFVCGGSCIGAVRHHDIIPWDDDIDICMPYSDCQKLIAIKDCLNDTEYDLLTIDVPGYFFPFPKIYKKTTTLWERYDYPFVYGAYVDIFPLYKTLLADEKEIDRLRHEFLNKTVHFQNVNQTFSAIRIWESICHFHARGVIRNITNAWNKRHLIDYKQEVQKIEKKLNNEDGNRIVIYTADKYGLEIWPMAWVEGYELMPFGDFNVRVPIGYDEYLTYLYGDYMKLPSEDKRPSVHGRYYVNLKEGLSIDEVRKRLRKGEKFVM